MQCKKMTPRCRSKRGKSEKQQGNEKGKESKEKKSRIEEKQRENKKKKERRKERTVSSGGCGKGRL
jgi:hypothetical protein